ncbi:cytochrome P450 [Zalerion maritima]|uniref:Cytochrome P450 n=1 Tax=Zalerion maritima TaxID=339359 RepID=A0AAD5RRR2_9PEZI|nr:cytochrome P450 [Zalerion maritima]
MSRPPQLPQSASTSLNPLAETFSFHSSPEQFIASRALSLHAANVSSASSQKPVKAHILGRNVVVLSSHAQVMHVLRQGKDPGSSEPKDTEPYVAAPAYAQLMGPFFPSPNLLLSEGEDHSCMRRDWEGKMAMAAAEALSPEAISRLTDEHFASLLEAGERVSLYATLKALAWKILLGVFLGLESEDELFNEVTSLQGDLLRGQFSVFPVSVNIGLWQSPRSKGIAARRKLQRILGPHVQKMRADGTGCPFNGADDAKDDVEEAANHLLLFTSSLSAKALASLLTAFLLNLFLSPGLCAGVAASTTAETERGRLLCSTLLETERLSPPIVGIMRRAQAQDVVVSHEDGHPATLIPSGWDAWLYFVGAGRDPSVFGANCDKFDPRRFMDSRSGNPVQDTVPTVAFSAGKKECLGKEFARSACLAVGRTLVQKGLGLEGAVDAPGVRAWLGWEKQGPEEWARDMRQLPTQRPAVPIMAKVVHL